MGSPERARMCVFPLEIAMFCDFSDFDMPFKATRMIARMIMMIRMILVILTSRDEVILVTIDRPGARDASRCKYSMVSEPEARLLLRFPRFRRPLSSLRDL